MDDDFEDTQPATQQLPAHNGLAPSHHTAQDFSGIICFLHPCSPAALSLVRHAQRRNPSLVYHNPEPQFTTRAQRPAPAPAPLDDDKDDSDEDIDATQVDTGPLGGENMSVDLALRYDPGPKDPSTGFLFGRNGRVCDVVLADPAAAATDPEAKRVSNVHFRLYVNEKAALMLEDLSTNGTWVDHKRLHRGGEDGRKRVLSPGSTIMLCPGGDTFIRFVVRIPRSGGYGLRSVRPTSMLEEPMPVPRVGRAGPEASPAKLPQRTTAVTGAIAPPRHVPTPRYDLRTPARGPARGTPQAPERRLDSHIQHVRPAAGIAWSGEGDYSLGEQVGKGAFATVYRAHERRTGDAVAVKIIAKRNFATQVGNHNEGVQKEVTILEKLRHPNIVRYVDCFEDQKLIYLVMEYIELGDLNTYLQEHGTMEESLTKVVAAQVLNGIEYIHSMGISHRDLKPDNILISQMDPIQIKISDFGLAKMIQNDNTFLKTFCGTMLYLAPEVFPAYIVLSNEGRPHEGAEKRKRAPNDDGGRKISKKDRRPYSQAVDMWSFGCITFALLCGSPPFQGKSQDDMFKMVTRGQFDEARLRRHVGPNNHACVDFVRRLLQVRPELRMMEREALNHEWLKSPSMSSGSVSSSMDYDEDEVAGVGYEPPAAGYGLRNPQMDMDDDEDSDEEEQESQMGSGSGSRGRARSESSESVMQEEEKHIRESMHQMVVGVPRFTQEVSSSLSSVSSEPDEEDFESLIGSTHEVSQGQTGLSVIDRENGVNGRKGPDSFSELPDDPSSDDNPAVHSGDDTRSAALDWQNDYSVHDSDFSSLHTSTLAEVTNTTRHNLLQNRHKSTTTPAVSTPRRSTHTPSHSPSFADQNYNANFSPASLANPSPDTTPKPKPAISSTYPLIPPHPADADLPPTQPTNCSFLTPAIPWGRLHPLPGSLPHDTITLSGPAVSIGRSLACSVVESDSRISKQHLCIQMHMPNNTTSPPNPLAWRPSPEMVVTVHAIGAAGVFLNGKHVPRRSAGMLCDGDELVVFKDRERGEALGFKVELTMGLVRKEDRMRFNGIRVEGRFIGAPDGGPPAEK